MEISFMLLFAIILGMVALFSSLTGVYLIKIGIHSKKLISSFFGTCLIISLCAIPFLLANATDKMEIFLKNGVLVGIILGIIIGIPTKEKLPCL